MVLTVNNLPSESDMHQYRDRHRIVWGTVAVIIVIVNSRKAPTAVAFVLVLAAALLGGILGGELYAWTWRLRARAWVKESLRPSAGIVIHADKNWGPLWRQITHLVWRARER